MSIEWTPDLRTAWDKSWSEPHMQMGLLLIKERLWPKTVLIPAGHDAQQVSAASFHSLVGNNQVFEQIEKLKQETHRPKPLPEPNSREALGLSTERPE